VSLSWEDTSDNEDGFQIERRVGPSGEFASLATTDKDVPDYTDGDVEASTLYCYRVRAANADGPSDFTTEECATTPSAGGLEITGFSLLWSSAMDRISGWFG